MERPRDSIDLSKLARVSKRKAQTFRERKEERIKLLTTADTRYSEAKRKHEEIDGKFRAILAKYDIKYPPCGCYFGAGWLPVIDEVLGKLCNAGWTRDLIQVKSKFCGLRVYIGEATHVKNEDDTWTRNTFGQIILDAEAKCDKMCEDCGAPHGLNVPRGGRALCKTCIENGRDKF